MIEGYILPFRWFVARGTVLPELPIVRILCRVTGETILRGALEDIVDMAGFAVDGDMRACQVEPGPGMIEIGGFPGGCGMTGFALRAELTHVHVHVTGGTVRGGPLEYIILVAARTSHSRVFSVQRKICPAVIKTHVHPGCRSVT